MEKTGNVHTFQVQLSKGPLHLVLFDNLAPRCGAVSPFFCGKIGESGCFSPAHVRGKTY